MIKILIIEKDVQFMGHDVSKASLFVNLAKHKIAKALGKSGKDGLKLKENNKRAPISEITAGSSKSDIENAIKNIPISGITLEQIDSGKVAKYICGPRGAAAMLAKSVFTKSNSEADKGFNNLVAKQLKTIKAPDKKNKGKNEQDPFATFDNDKRKKLCDYTNNKKRGKEGKEGKEGKDARLADWLKRLCDWLVLYVTAPSEETQQEPETEPAIPETKRRTQNTNEADQGDSFPNRMDQPDFGYKPRPPQNGGGTSPQAAGAQRVTSYADEIPEGATVTHDLPSYGGTTQSYNYTIPTSVGVGGTATFAANDMAGMFGGIVNDDDIPLSSGDYTNDEPQLYDDTPNLPPPITPPQCEFPDGLSVPPPVSPSQPPQCEIPEDLPPPPVSPSQPTQCEFPEDLPVPPPVSPSQQPQPQQQQTNKNGPKYKLVAHLTGNEKQSILDAARTLAGLAAANPGLTPDQFVEIAKNVTPINTCTAEASFSFANINQVTTDYEHKYDFKCELNTTLRQYYERRLYNAPHERIEHALIALVAGNCTFIFPKCTQQLDVVTANHSFLAQVRTILFPPNQKKQPNQQQQNGWNQTQQYTQQYQPQAYQQQQTTMNPTIPAFQPPPPPVSPNQPQQNGCNQPQQYPQTYPPQPFQQQQQPAIILTPEEQQEQEQQRQVDLNIIGTYNDGPQLTVQFNDAKKAATMAQNNYDFAQFLLNHFRNYYRDDNFANMVTNYTYTYNGMIYYLTSEWQHFLYYAQQHKIRTVEQLTAIPQKIQDQNDTIVALQLAIKNGNAEEMLIKFKECIVAHFDFTPGANLQTRMTTLNALLYNSSGTLNQLAKDLVAKVAGPKTLTSEQLNDKAKTSVPKPMDANKIANVQTCLNDDLIKIPQPDGSPFLPGDQALALYNQAFEKKGLKDKIYHIFMAASQTNGLESCDNQHAPLNKQICDPTQGPTSCSQAILAWIKRELMYETDGQLKELDTIKRLLSHLRDLKKPVIKCMQSSPTDQGTWVATNDYYNTSAIDWRYQKHIDDPLNYPDPGITDNTEPKPYNYKYPVYQNGYFQPWTLNSTGKTALLNAMTTVQCSYMSQDAQSNNGEQTFTQNFAAAFSYQDDAGNYKFDATDYIMNFSWIYPQYDHIIKDAIIKSGNKTDYEIILVHLTNIGQGAFNNPKGIAELASAVAIFANADKLSRSNIVIRKDYNATDDLTKISNCLNVMLNTGAQQQLNEALNDDVVKALNNLWRGINNTYKHLCGGTIKCYELNEDGTFLQQQQQQNTWPTNSWQQMQ